MKLLKIISASALAMTVAGSAFATNVQVTGSTAIRKAFYSGIITTLTNEAGGSHVVRVASCDPNFNNKTPDGAQQATFINDIGDSVQACLSGSVGGIGYVVDSADLQVATSVVANGGDVSRAWIAVPATYAAAVAANWPTVTPAFVYGAGLTNNGAVGNLGLESSLPAFGSAGTPFSAPSSASICMSDSFQNSSIYDSGDWGLTLSDTIEGTVTFEFCKGAQANNVTAAQYADLKNISSQNFQALANKGIIDLYQITGVATDTGVDVILVGRNDDSGTRLGVFAETGIGSTENSAKQYIPLDINGVDASQTSSTLQIKSWAIAPGTAGLSGYDSGAFVKQTLNDTIVAGAVSPNGRPFIEVGYVSAGDQGGTPLTYNGVAMTQANVIEGTYTLWTTEHLMYDPTPGALSAAQLAFVNSLKTQITATVSNGNYVNIGGLNCSRTLAEGSTVLHN
jgi:hypothetical protein